MGCLRSATIVQPQKYSEENEQIRVKARGYKPWLRVTKVEGDSVYCRIDYTSDSKRGHLQLVLHKDAIEEIATIKTRPHSFSIFVGGVVIGGAITFGIVGLMVSD